MQEADDAATEQADDERDEVEHHQPIVAVMTMRRNRSVTLMIWVRYSTQHHCEHAERGTDGLQHDAVLIRLVGLEMTPRKKPSPTAYTGAEELGPHRPEVDGDHAGEADEDADQRQRREAADLASDSRDRLPADDGSGEEHDHQHAGGGDACHRRSSPASATR